MNAVDRFRIGLAQADTEPGRVDENLRRISDYVERARDEDVNLLLFPELALTGYLVRERFADVAVHLESPEIDRLRELSRDVSLAVGFIEETDDARFFNSAIMLTEGEIVHLHRKVYPPTYGMFDERRYFGAGSTVSAFPTPWGRMALLICGDCWHLALPYLAARDGADVLLVLAASSEEGLSPSVKSREAWLRLNQTYALTLSCFVVFVNRAGSEGDLHFWGGSHIAKPDGNILVEGAVGKPDFVVTELDLRMVRQQRIVLPFRRDDDMELTIRVARRIRAEAELHVHPSVRRHK